MASNLALAAIPDAAAGGAASRAPLRRPRESLVSGTSEAVAAHFGWRVGGVRAIFVLLTLLWGAGALLYAWLWVFVPLEGGRDDESVAPSHRAPIAWILTTLAVIGLLGAFGAIPIFGSGGVLFASM